MQSPPQSKRLQKRNTHHSVHPYHHILSKLVMCVSTLYRHVESRGILDKLLEHAQGVLCFKRLHLQKPRLYDVIGSVLNRPWSVYSVKILSYHYSRIYFSLISNLTSICSSIRELSFCCAKRVASSKAFKPSSL